MEGANFREVSTPGVVGALFIYFAHWSDGRLCGSELGLIEQHLRLRTDSALRAVAIIDEMMERYLELPYAHRTPRSLGLQECPLRLEEDACGRPARVVFGLIAAHTLADRLCSADLLDVISELKQIAGADGVVRPCEQRLIFSTAQRWDVEVVSTPLAA